MLKFVQTGFGTPAGSVLDLKSLLTAKELVADERDEAIQFHQGVLERGGGEQHLAALTQGVVERERPFGVGLALVYVA